MPSAVADGSDLQDGRVIKRQKIVGNEVQIARSSGHSSRIFAPFRTVGLVSPTSVPFTSIPLGKTTFQITTSVGSSLQTYDLRRGLNLVFLTRPRTPEIITSTIAWKESILAAWGKDKGLTGVWVYKRGKKTGELEIPDDLDEPVQKIIVFGSWIVGCCRTRIEIWKSSTLEHYTTLVQKGSKTASLTGDICGMPTFLNKIFVGKQDGSVEIWNVSTGKLIYTIQPVAVNTGAVTALEPTPALSLLAIAYSNGSIVIHDVRTDEIVIHLNQKGASGPPTTSISFRTDGLGAGDEGRKAGVMATASSGSPDVTFWDLNNGARVTGVLRGAHIPASVEGGVSGGVTKVEFLPGQPVIVTGGLDNSLKSWIFDETPFSPIPRILHLRCGHAAPVKKLEFVPAESDGSDASGKWLLSAGGDRSLWGWSLRRDGQSTELSQGNIRKKAKKSGILANASFQAEQTRTLEDLKAPEITCMACCLNRDGGMGNKAGNAPIWTNVRTNKQAADTGNVGATSWESIVTGHKGDRFARTWFWGRKKAGRWIFETSDGGDVSSVEISPCGTFAFIGSTKGSIDMFNLQSGIHRQRFPPKLTPGQAKKLKLGQDPGYNPAEWRHNEAVTGISVDGLNRRVISCSKDGSIKFWDFATARLLDTMDWSTTTTIRGSRYYRQNDLLALSCDDQAIRVIDAETKKVVRELWGCRKHINDFCFSPDGRWIVTSSGDSIIRVFDLTTGHLIDAVKLPSVCTAMAFSPTGEFLATSHPDSVGVNIWTNRSLFMHVSTRPISEKEIAAIDTPTATGEGGQGLLEAAFENDDADEPPSNSLAGTTTMTQLSKQLETLSVVPKARWQTLLHLDVIRQRNKPIEPPKAPEKAPFFLPSVGNGIANPSTVLELASPSETSISKPETPSSRLTKLDSVSLTSTRPFTTLLHAAVSSVNYTPFIEHLKTLSPAAADLEIRSLSPVSTSSAISGNDVSELTAFVQALTSRLRHKLDYELVQAWMAVFLRCHGEILAQWTEGEDERLVEDLRVALQDWKMEQQKEQERLGALVGYCRGVIGFLRSAR